MQLSYIHSFNLLLGEIDGVYHEAALKLGLSDSGLTLLYAMCSSGGSCLVSDIVKLSGLSKQTVSSSLGRLESSGIIQLEKAEGKYKRACFTPRGEAEIRPSIQKILQMESRIFSSWKKEEQELYFALTKRYLEQMKEEMEGFEA